MGVATALLRKDWRLNRVVVVGAVVLSVLPYVLPVANLRFNPPKYQVPGLRDYLDAVQFSASACLALSVVLAAAFGGLAFAAERRERTAEFLAMVPVSRAAVVLSKLVVAAVCMAVLIAVHVVVIAVTCRFASIAGIRLHGATPFEAGGMAAAFAVALFGFAWALSVFLHSPAIAASIAIALGIGLLFGGAAWAETLSDYLERRYGGRLTEETVLTILSSFAAGFGLLMLFASSVYYLRRVEP
jgi:ABC-type transport system involved in multi-copper enzyme maturation permease subunit